MSKQPLPLSALSLPLHINNNDRRICYLNSISKMTLNRKIQDLLCFKGINTNKYQINLKSLNKKSPNNDFDIIILLIN